MRLQDTIAEWEGAVLGAGPEPFEQLWRDLEHAMRTGSEERLVLLTGQVARLVLVDPGRARQRLLPLTQPTDANTAIDSAMAALPSPMQLAYLDVYNVASCMGLPLQVERNQALTLISGLTAVEMPRLLRTRLGFAALSFGDPKLAASIAASLGRSCSSFDSVQTQRGDVCGLLCHLVGAQESNADRFAVLPAWRALIELVTKLRVDGQLDELTLLWIARDIYHVHGKRPLGETASATHEILWRVASELERYTTERSEPRSSAIQFPVGYTLGRGMYAVDGHLLEGGTRQLCFGHARPDAAPVLVACGLTGKAASRDELYNSISYDAPGVFKLEYVGGFDPRGLDDNYVSDSRFAVVERVTEGSWLPHVIARAHDAQRAPRMAIQLGLSAGRIATSAAARGLVLTGIRPELMWGRCTAGQWEVTGMSARADALFQHGGGEMVTAPIFDRYYYAPEWYDEPDDRAIVYSLAVMIAEWAMGRYPFKHLFPNAGLETANHLPLGGPPMLIGLLERSIRLERKERPRLDQFLQSLAKC